MIVTIGISNRHVHLTKKDLEYLFGENYELKVLKKINQPGQFAATDKVKIKGPKGEIDNVRILGPVREYTQVEVSKTDSYKLGLNPPVRDSGDIDGSEPITIIGPNGELKLEQGCIIATRHIHLNSRQASLYGLEGIKKVDVLLKGEKGGILSNVDLKISDASYYEMHIDTDDANAHLVNNGDIAEIIAK